MFKSVVDVHKGLASAVFPGVGSWHGQQEANEANKDLFNKQTQLSWDMWNAQNTYNDPTAVMGRLQRAGLNPNMAYGEIGGGRAGAVSVPAAPDMKAAAPSFALGDFQQVVNMQAQNKLIREQAAKVAADTAVTNENKELIKVQKDAAKYELDMLKASGMSRFDQTPGKYVVRKAMSKWDNAEKSFDRSALWQGVLDSVSKVSEALHTREYKYPRKVKEVKK